ncbi:MAG TPA: ABC transporter ATP-binding protein [Caldithrix abyssi]|uniref:ABC transporter ATP-binding protein n=1 Tax=Caldithrix abyssi TaxID=187145 RepID=A0A7V5UFR8_CALAY|nr:ABC transporter ATP-binding protein [Caldithrix abyssi]
MSSILRVENLVKNFGGLRAVDNVSFEVQEGEIFGLIGPNGSGKTTTFNLINHYFPVTSGKIFFKDQDITNKKTFEIARLGIGRTFQVVKPLKRLSVHENVMAAAFARESTFAGAKKVADEMIEFCRLQSVSHKKAGGLPIAGRKRLEIARALATRPSLLLLDETAAGLNPSELDEAIEIITDIRGKLGITIIIVEHIMKVIMSISDRIHAIAHGATIAEGKPEEVAKDPTVIEAYLGSDYNVENFLNA